MITVMMSDIVVSFRRGDFCVSMGPSHKEYCRTLYDEKNLLLSESLCEKLPRFDQSLFARLRVRNDADHHQHTRHAGKQQPNLRQSFFSRFTRNKWRQPFPISLQQRFNSPPDGQRLSRELRAKGRAHATGSRRIQMAYAQIAFDNGSQCLTFRRVFLDDELVCLEPADLLRDHCCE